MLLTCFLCNNYSARSSWWISVWQSEKASGWKRWATEYRTRRRKWAKRIRARAIASTAELMSGLWVCCSTACWRVTSRGSSLDTPTRSIVNFFSGTVTSAIQFRLSGAVSQRRACECFVSCSNLVSICAASHRKYFATSTTPGWFHVSKEQKVGLGMTT